MEKQIDDAENIGENYDVIRDVTNGMPFSTKRSEWDKMSKISSENLIEVAAIAKRARQTANIAKGTACKAAKKVKFKRANEASAHADRAEAEAHLAEARHLVAEQEDNDVHLIYERLCKKQKTAFIAAEVAAKRLVQRARCKTVLTTAAKVAKQKQRQRRQRRELAIATAKAVGKRQQTEQQVVEADMPATRA